MELWDLYTKDRIKTDKTMVRGESTPERYYRMVIHICIFNSEGKMLIQHRQPFKSGWSDMWDVSVGGSAVLGDSSAAAAERELREELGLEMSFENIRPSLTLNFSWGFDDIYIVKKNVDLSQLSLQYEEVKEVRWADADEIRSMIDDGSFIPYHKSYIDMLFFRKDSTEMVTHGDTTKIKKEKRNEKN